MKRACFWTSVIFLIITAGVETRADPLSWVNAVRRASGARPVAVDTVLMETASRWARMLAETGVLSHKGSDGSSALDRYRALGGKDVHVGEILGAGPSLEDVEKGWMGSAEHRRLALNGAWTHAGWGSAVPGEPGGAASREAGSPAGAATTVWVMVFCERLVDDLAVRQDERGLAVTGRFVTAEAKAGMFFSGIDPVQPAAWDPATLGFTFLVPGTSPSGYYRLGYRTSEGRFVWTNAFTWPPETVFPAGPAHSAAPAQRP